MNRFRLTTMLFAFLFASPLVALPAYAQDSTPAPEVGVVGEAIDVSVKSDIGTVEVPDGATSYTLDATQSTASYKVMEELTGRGDNEVTGTTGESSVVGMLIFDDQGAPLAGSRIDVDLRTLATDDAKRDGRVQETLDTTNNPVATFVITSVEGLDGGLVDGEEVSFTIIGNLTVAGVTKSVAWSATAKLDGDSLNGTATTVITFDDYGLEKPVIGPVASIEDELTLTITLTANKDS